MAGVAAAGGVAGCSGNSNEASTPGSTETPVGTPETTETSTGTPESADTPSETPTSNLEGSVSFVMPEDGAEVVGPVNMHFESEAFDIVQQGKKADRPAQYNLLVDSDPIPEAERVPNAEGVIFFSRGQDGGPVELEPGEHRLVLQTSDNQFNSYGVHDEITVNITDRAGVEITSPGEGSTVEPPFTLTADAENTTITEPTGERVQGEHHLHLIVGRDPLNTGLKFSEKAQRVHEFSAGETEIEVTEEMLPDSFGTGNLQFHVQLGNSAEDVCPVTDSVQLFVAQ